MTQVEDHEPELEPDDEADARGLPDETIWQRQVRFFVGICSIAAGVLHVLAAGAHIDHHADLGRAFLMVAALQVAWGVMLMVAPTRFVVVSGMLGTLAATVVWVLSRTEGIGAWDALAAVEPIEWRDTVTMWFQILAIAGAVLLLIPKSANEPAAGRPLEVTPIAIIAVLAMLGIGILYAATHSYVHHDDHGPGVETGHMH